MLDQYLKKNLDKWYRHANRDHAPVKREAGHFDLFSRRLFPPSCHERVLARGERAVQELLGQRAIHYDRGTAQLETEAIIPELLSFHKGAFQLVRGAPTLREVAAQTINDEALHTANAARVEAAVTAAGIVPINFGRPHFLRCLDAELDRLTNDEQQLIRFAFCFATETLISGTLKDIPKDLAVDPIIREEISQHAVDEGRHRELYGQRFMECWSCFTLIERRVVAKSLPKFIREFLQPDLQAIRAMLLHIGFCDSHATEILQDSYPPEAVDAVIRASATACIHYCRRAGVFDTTEFAESFNVSRLVH